MSRPDSAHATGLSIAYRFHVLPRYRAFFCHAYHAAQDSLHHIPGLLAYSFVEPLARRAAYSLVLTWDGQASFERFTRTLIGVWLLNGMGLHPQAFFSPIETECAQRALRPRLRSRPLCTT